MFDQQFRADLFADLAGTNLDVILRNVGPIRPSALRYGVAMFAIKVADEAIRSGWSLKAVSCSPKSESAYVFLIGATGKRVSIRLSGHDPCDRRGSDAALAWVVSHNPAADLRWLQSWLMETRR